MSTNAPQQKTTGPLAEARVLRMALAEAADAVEDLVARPATHPQWTSRVGDSLDGLRTAFADHVTEVEADDGLLRHILDDQPRLVRGIERMNSDHIEIQAAIEAAIDLVRGCGDMCDQDATESIRSAVVDLMGLISRHRQAGADLVYEAYSVDIGGG